MDNDIILTEEQAQKKRELEQLALNNANVSNEHVVHTHLDHLNIPGQSAIFG